MAQLKIMAILLVVAAASAILHSTEAANYTIGGSTGWTNSPPGGASFYSNWASNITFKENDTLVFNFVSGHTVAVLTKANFDSCNANQNTQHFSTSPARFTLSHTGEFYFACSIPGHCSSGQKLSVNVTGSSSPAPGKAPPPAQGPSPPAPGTTPSPSSNVGAPPPSSPSEPGATPPPSPSGSATSLAATFSLLLITVVLNFLF